MKKKDALFKATFEEKEIFILAPSWKLALVEAIDSADGAMLKSLTLLSTDEIHIAKSDVPKGAGHGSHRV